MATKLRETFGKRVRYTVTLEAGEAVAVQLDAAAFATVSAQITVASGDSASAHGSLDDAATPTQGFPLFGEDGSVLAGTARSVCLAYPGPLRTVRLAAAAENAGTVRVVILH